jgi:uncharacterized membrane protein
MFSLDYLHHQVIHFPIALLSISIFFDFLAIYFKNHKLFFSGWCTLLTGALLSVVAIITGFIADIVYGHMSEPFPIFQTHGSTQIIAAIFFIGLCLWRYSNNHIHTKPPAGYFILGVISVCILFYGSHLGAGLAGHY